MVGALDVFEGEEGEQLAALLGNQMDNVIVTPHIASASIRARNKMAMLTTDNLLAGLRGERLPHCVNPEAYG